MEISKCGGRSLGPYPCLHNKCPPAWRRETCSRSCSGIPRHLRSTPGPKDKISAMKQIAIGTPTQPRVNRVSHSLESTKIPTMEEVLRWLHLLLERQTNSRSGRIQVSIGVVTTRPNMGRVDRGGRRRHTRHEHGTAIARNTLREELIGETLGPSSPAVLDPAPIDVLSVNVCRRLAGRVCLALGKPKQDNKAHDLAAAGRTPLLSSFIPLHGCWGYRGRSGRPVLVRGGQPFPTWTRSSA